MLPGSADSFAPRASNRISVRLDVPDRLIRMTAFGLWNLDDDSRAGRRWWDRVNAEMEAFVAAELPDAATRVEMALDAERMEVVLGYELSA